MTFNGSVIYHKSHWIQRICRHTTQAEMIQLSDTVCDVLYYLNMMEEFGVPVLLPVTVYCDNRSTCYLAENSTLKERTKYFQLDELFVRQWVEQGVVRVQHCMGTDTPADGLTKPYSITLHKWHEEQCGIRYFE